MSGAPPPRVLVLGSSGLVGSEVVRAVTRRRWFVHGTSRSPVTAKQSRLDLVLPTCADDAGRIATSVRASHAVVCAGMSTFQECDRDPDLARTVNAVHTAAVVQQLSDLGIKVLVISSRAVFGCGQISPKESTPRCPDSIYGRTKADLEDYIMGQVGVVVLRPTKLISERLLIFRNWIVTLRAGKRIYPHADAYLAPVSLREASELIADALVGESRPVVHLSPQDEITYAEAAMLIAERLGSDQGLVVPRWSRNRRQAERDFCHASLGSGGGMLGRYAAMSSETVAMVSNQIGDSMGENSGGWKLGES